MEKEYNFKQSEKSAIHPTSKGSGFSCLNSHKAKKLYPNERICLEFITDKKNHIFFNHFPEMA